MLLTCMTDVAANPFEELDRFRNAPPLRVEALDADYFGEKLEEGYADCQRFLLCDGSFSNFENL